MAVTAQALRLQAQLDAYVQQVTDAQTRALTAAWVYAWAEVSSDLQDTLEELFAAAADAGGTVVSRATMARSLRLRAVLGQVAARLDDLAVQAGVRITSDLRGVVDAAAEAQRGILTAQLPPLLDHEVAALVDARRDSLALDAIVRRTTQQITSRTKSLSREAEDAVRRELIRAVAVGENPRVTARRMVRRSEKGFNGGLTRALNVSRTEVLDAHRAAAKVQQDQNTEVLAGWVWLAHLDTSMCPACLARHGTLHELDEAGPEGHPQCVLPGAVVSGPRAQASTTRWFAGEVIDIETRSGRVLSVTPNHPVLTPQGWVPAGVLREGDHVVAGTGADRPAVGGRPDDHQVPALIENVAQTLGRSLPVDAVRVPTAPKDFHGDGAGSKVHVVRTDRLLWDHSQATGFELGRQASFVVGDVGLQSFTGGGTLGLGLDALRDATLGGVSRLHDRPVLLRGARGGHGPVHLSGSTGGHTCGRQSVVDRSTRAAVGLRQGVDGFAGRVPTDDLVVRQGTLREHGVADSPGSGFGGVASGAPLATLDEDALESQLAYPVPSRDSLGSFAGEVVEDGVLHVRRRRWQGHVYNLQTATGWFLANGILTHNCRCARMPLVKPWAELGFDVAEPEDLVPDARAWFDQLSVEQQIQLMGRRRWELFTSGQVQWADLASLRKTNGWRDSWVITPLKDLLGQVSGSRRAS